MKNIFQEYSKIFQTYFKNIFPKVVTKGVKKQVVVACVIPFAPSCWIPISIIHHDIFIYTQIKMLT